ncbi:hypothetical protein [Neptuniibacter sp. QD37_11]|uniref:hypothetical protein n=1 Tax=Neptuniibacter sp. QD37_11 TaxID=3398209 RepID=UPI0039F5B165
MPNTHRTFTENWSANYTREDLATNPLISEEILTLRIRKQESEKRQKVLLISAIAVFLSPIWGFTLALTLQNFTGFDLGITLTQDNIGHYRNMISLGFLGSFILTMALAVGLTAFFPTQSVTLDGNKVDIHLHPNIFSDVSVNKNALSSDGKDRRFFNAIQRDTRAVIGLEKMIIAEYAQL